MYKRNPDIDKRSRQLKQGTIGSGPVVYWMSRDQRASDNWALLWAQQEALLREKALIVIFCLIPDYPEAQPSHYNFMLHGLLETKNRLTEKNISFFFFQVEPTGFLPHFLQKIDAHLLVCDFDPLRIKKEWNKTIQKKILCPMVQVDAHNIIPAWTVSDKKEYAAYTIRPKIHRLLPEFLTEIPELLSHPKAFQLSSQLASSFASALTVIKTNEIADNYPFQPGAREAEIKVDRFIRIGLNSYSIDRNNPCLDGQSGLSPYLHFGQLSAQRLALTVSTAKVSNESKDDFLEELIVRRELSDNFCFYEENYDNFSAFSDWAKKSLNIHRTDKREYIYSYEQLEQGATHEKLWNSCQKDLIQSEKLHGFLRMYWAKKILEWTPDPETAMQYAIKLNDRYSLDGRDPNGYAGIAWSIGGVHDRAWKERAVFGKIRYMNEAGCRRKFNVEQYINTVDQNARQPNLPF